MSERLTDKRNGFNWATPVKAWRWWNTMVVGSGCRSLQLGHAGEGVEMAMTGAYGMCRCTRFNWATPVKAWRSLPCEDPNSEAAKLQLGHAGEGVEIK